MNPDLLLKTLRAYRTTLLLMAAGLLGLGMLIPSTYQAFGGPGFDDLVKSMPKGILALLKSQAGQVIGSGPQGYISTGFRHPIFLIVASAFAIGAAASLAREIEDRTIYLVLSRPIPRFVVVATRYAGMALGLTGLMAAMLAGTWVGSQLGGVTGLRLGNFVVVLVNAYLLFLAIGSVSLLIASRSNDGGRAIGLAAVFTLFAFFLDFLSGLWDPAAFLGPLSLFHYYDSLSVALSGRLPLLHAGVLAAVSILAGIAAMLSFERRDIA